MSDKKTLGEMLTERGVSRRTFLKYASYTASIMALPPTAATAMAQGIANARRQSVIWLSFQECTGCTESITRAHTPSIEDLIFELKRNYTIVIVTHNMQQAARISDRTAFFYEGHLIEMRKTKELFTKPIEKHTEDYITGRFG